MILDTTTLLIIVCVLASLAAAGMVSPWAPVMGPVLSMLASSALASGLHVVTRSLNPPK